MRFAASIGLKPDEFYSLTPREFELYAQGVSDRRHYYAEMSAWAQSNLISVHMDKGKSIKPSDLLKPRESEKTESEGRAQALAAKSALEAMTGKKKDPEQELQEMIDQMNAQANAKRKEHLDELDDYWRESEEADIFEKQMSGSDLFEYMESDPD